jgi:DNA primase catalytic subunit
MYQGSGNSYKDVLRDFYSKQFPRIWKEGLERIVTCDGQFKLEQCEIVPRDLKKDGQDIMNRHIFFRTREELFDHCLKRLPLTLQLGGIYPMLYPDLNDHDCRDVDKALIKAGAVTTQKPFVIDCDMDKTMDRTGICKCTDVETCIVCWDYYMHSARLIIDFLLRNICKLRKVAHFWSGRRGLHIWCFDPRAIAWSKEERANVMKVFMNRDALIHLLPDDLKRMPWPKFDDEVSIDQRHCIGLPLLPHHSTSCIRIMLPPLSKDEKFDPKLWLKQACLSRQSINDFQYQLETLNVILNE